MIKSKKIKEINPPVGGFFRLGERVYRANRADRYSCYGCCFFKEYATSLTCSIPHPVNCDMKVFKDVTDDIADMEIELIDDPARKKSIWPLVLFCVAFWTTVIILLIN